MYYKDFMCIKDYVMENDDIAFKKGKVYNIYCYGDKGGIDEQDEYHVLVPEKEFNKYFKEVE